MNKVVVITGASRGIGREIAHRFARRGYCVCLASRGSHELQKVQEECFQLGASQCIYVQTDVTSERACEELIGETVKRFGRIDALVLNAGANAHFAFSKDVDLQVFRKLMDVNLFGYVNCVKYALEHLRRSHGKIIVISSVSGEIGLPLRTAYCASKFAVTGFFESLRAELDDVTITICCPSSVSTTLRDESEYAKAEQQLHCLRHNSSLNEYNSSGAHVEGPLQGNRSHTRSLGVMYSSGRGETRMSVEECVDHIMRAADSGATKSVFPFLPKLAVYVQPFFPNLINRIIRYRSKL